jgi:hypothetical protein
MSSDPDKRRASRQRCNQSAKGQADQQRYSQSAQGQASKQRYLQSAKGLPQGQASKQRREDKLAAGRAANKAGRPPRGGAPYMDARRKRGTQWRFREPGRGPKK